MLHVFPCVTLQLITATYLRRIVQILAVSKLKRVAPENIHRCRRGRIVKNESHVYLLLLLWRYQYDLPIKVSHIPIYWDMRRSTVSFHPLTRLSLQLRVHACCPRHGAKSIAGIECPGGAINGVDNQRFCTNLLRHAPRAMHRIEQQISTKTLALISFVDTKHTQQNDRNLRRPGHPSPTPLPHRRRKAAYPRSRRRRESCHQRTPYRRWRARCSCPHPPRRARPQEARTRM